MGLKTNFMVSPALSDTAEWGPVGVGVEWNGEWREHEFGVKSRLRGLHMYIHTHKDLCLS